MTQERPLWRILRISAGKQLNESLLRTRDLTGFEHHNLKRGMLETHATRGICHVPVKNYVVALKSRIQYQLQLIG
jgi:hypothetical protein